MNARTLILALAMSLLMWLAILATLFAIATHAATPRRLAPPVVCTMHNRLDIFVDEDNILWACECEALKTGHICRWQVIGGVDAVDSRRRHLVKPKRIVAFTIPAVVA